MHAPNPNNPNRAATIDRDLLISRLLDARASDADWLAFRDSASIDQSVWNDIVAARRDMLRLESGIASASMSADRFNMPELRFESAPAVASRQPWTSRSGLVGWAVAAVLALGFIAQQAGLKTGFNAPISAGIVNVPQTPPELLQKYIEAGRKDGLVLGEVPQRMVVETRPREEGGHEVIFYRLLLERAIVDDNGFRTFGQNENGEQVLVPASPPQSVKSSY